MCAAENSSVGDLQMHIPEVRMGLKSIDGSIHELQWHARISASNGE